MSRFMPQTPAPGQSLSPQIGGSVKAWCLWGTSLDVQHNASQPVGTIVTTNARVLTHESPEFRSLALQLTGDVFGPDDSTPRAWVDVRVGVGGEVFSRTVEVGPPGVVLAVPAGVVYAEVVRYNNTLNTKIHGRISSGVRSVGALTEWYSVPAGSQVFVPFQPFASSFRAQNFTAAVIAGEVVTPWYTFALAGPASFQGPFPQGSLGINLAETGGVADAEVVIEWQIEGA